MCVGGEPDLERKIREIVLLVQKERQLSDQQADCFKEVLTKHREVFSDRPGVTHECFHQIKLRDDTPFYIRPYRVPDAYRKQVQDEIEKMIEWGVIERATSSYVSPMLIVKKPGGGLRLCIDLRRLNSQLWNEHDKPVEIEEILNKFHGKKYFSSVDMIWAYWQVPVLPEHQHLVAFSINNQTYKFKRLAFGLSTAVSSFTRCMETVLGPQIMKNTIVYIDDLLTISSTFEGHMKQLSQLLARLQEAGFTLHLEKCQFLQTKIVFVGHEITREGILPKPATITQIIEFPTPKNLKMVRSFWE